jgi:SAM-dependent methyltransferase
VNTNVWDARADAYRRSEAHAQGPDLDLLVEWAEGAETAVDVASGGGHVARRLREAGLTVVTVDPAPGMRADVRAPAEHLPFADKSFDLSACRVAAHHFADVEAALGEMARVASGQVLLVDNLNMGEEAEEAERLRDPSHVRNYDEAEWPALFAGAGLEPADVRVFDRPIGFAAWLERTGCSGRDAERVRTLLGDHVDGDELRLRRIALRGVHR